MQQNRWARLAAGIFPWLAATIVLLSIAWLAGIRPFEPAHAAGPSLAPTITQVSPSSAPNDLDTTVVITGTGFTAVPTVSLGTTVLDDAGWVSSERLTATVPWGLDPGAYTLTVAYPGGEVGSLTNAFTVTQGIGVWTTHGPYGGEIVRVRTNPHRPSTVYAIAQGMGLLASDDGAATWRPLLFNLNPPDQISVDAQNPDVLYAGFANGFVRSTDGGNTWEQMGIYGIPFRCWEHYMVAHPTLAGTVYAATWGFTVPDQEGDVFRSDDYGESWITLTMGLTDTDFTHLAIHPIATETLLVGTANGNLYYSLDAGGTWTHTAQIGHELLGVYFNPYEPLEAWAAGKDAPHLFRSTDLITWTPVVVDAGHAGEGSHNWDMAFLSDTIWVAAWGVYTSTNNGVDWTWLDEAPAALSIGVHPGGPQEIYAGDFTDGVYKSADGGQTWRLASEGLAGLNPVAVAVAPDDPETVYAKVNFSLIKSQDGGQTWRSLDFAQGGFAHRTKLAIDPFLPERLYVGYGTDDAPRLWIHEHGGEELGDWISVTATLPLTYAGWGGRFYTLAPHPAVSGRILAGIYVWSPGDEREEGLLYGSDDYGLTWDHLGPTQPISWVTEIAFDSQNPDLIYAATQGTGLWKSTDGGQSWAPTPNPGGFASMEFVTTHPHIADTVYVNASGEGSQDDGGLFVSHDAGETWTHLTWQSSVQLLFAPTQPPTLLTACGLGDEFGAGVCQSQDDGQTWEQLDGISWPTAMAAGTDGERVMIYVGTPGGMVSPMSATGTMNPEGDGTRAGEYGALGGGVYRMTTTLSPGHQVYLPLVLKGPTP